MEYQTVNQHRSPQSELFDLLDRLQSARLDDQRCELPNFNIKTSQQTISDSRQTASKQMLQRILKHPPPYPTVALVNQGSHWIDPNSEVLKVIPEQQLTGLCEYLRQLREVLTAIQKSVSHQASFMNASFSPQKAML